MKECGYKRGGKAKKKGGKVDGDKAKNRPDKFARGGAAKKGHKTQVNVMVGSPHGAAPAPMPPAAPPMAPPMGMPPKGGLPGAVPGMKRGGKVMTAGAKSGEGRLEKIDLQKGK